MSTAIQSVVAYPQFRFVEFNPRRRARGKEGARVEVTFSSESDDSAWLWMSVEDIRENVREFGHHPELTKALEAYFQ